jgi:multidrug efflux system membrane fusion protein
VPGKLRGLPRVCAARGFVALSFAVAAFGCAGGQTGAKGAGREALAVRTSAVAARDVVYEVKALGSLEPQELVRVTAEVDGVATEVLFHEGDKVTPATVLVRLDPARYRLERDRAKASLAQATADLSRSSADLARREQLAADRLVAPEELNRARSEASRFSAAVEVAQAALGIAEQNLGRSDVRAAAGGSIDTRSVETGQYVRTGTALATLVDTSRLKLRFKVGDAESLRARVGQELQFRVSALGPKTFPATVYHVGEMADPATRQVEVLAWVKNPGDLKPGFFAEVTLAAASRKRSTVVPEGAVLASDRGFVSYIVENGKARARPVEVGLRTGDGWIEIVTGLETGEVVVTEGSDRLADGMLVRVVEDSAASREAPK